MDKIKIISPIVIIVVLIFISIIGAVIHLREWNIAHEKACKYLEERVSEAERKLQQDFASNMQLYSEEEADEIIEMFKDIKAEGSCHKQYQKFQNHLKKHPLKGKQ